MMIALLSITCFTSFSQTSTVVLSGVGGNSSQQMLNRIQADVLDHNPETTILLAGTNDMLNSGKNITLSQFEGYLIEIVEKILEANSEIVIMTIPPCVEELLFERHDEAYFEPEGPNGRVDLANEIVEEVALEYGLVLVDMNDLFVNDIGLLSNDGVHPSTTGYTTMSNMIYDAIEDNCLPTGTVVCFGNSITRGYSPIFQEQLTDNPINCDGGMCSEITANLQVNGEDFCESQGVTVNDATEGGSYIGGIQAGDYLSYGVFDFDSNPIDAIEVAVGKSTTKDTYIEVRLDSPTGTLIGTVDVSEATGGSQNWGTEWVNLNPTNGEHEVFLVFTGEVNVTLVNFNWFKLFEVDVCFINATERPFHIEAECLDEISGAQIEESDANGISDIGSIKDGYWTKYNDIDLTSMNSVSITASSDGSGGSVELRLNSIDGELIGTVDVPTTGGWNNWESFTANIDQVNGENDIYLIFTGDDGWLYNIDYFGFSEEEIVVTNLNDIALNDRISVFPNPFDNNVTVLVNSSKAYKVDVLNVMGSIITTYNTNEKEFNVDLSEQSDGLYIVKITNDGQVITKQVLKKSR